MDDFKSFMTKYWGGFLGAIVALILACTGAYRVVVGIVLVCCGAWVGNYIQHHKDKVKSNLKGFIDKM